MDKIGFGFFCFGEDYYYRGTLDKVREFLNLGATCYILTENLDYFSIQDNLHIIPYSRENKSYHDKLVLVDSIFKNHDIAILIDADIHIQDYSFVKLIQNYKFEQGISYIKSLSEHPCGREKVKDLINPELEEWKPYREYLEKLYTNYGDLDTIWEYFLVFNRQGFNQEKFFDIYNTLQVAKEAGDKIAGKEVLGAGEGISIQISGKLSNTPVAQDIELNKVLSDNLQSISRKFIRPEFWPDWMK